MFLTGPGSSNDRASTSGVGGPRFKSRACHTKDIEMVPLVTLLGTQQYSASTGFFHSQNRITNIHFV